VEVPVHRPSANAYLAGNFAPVTDELEVTDLAISGTLPPELDGLLLRNGPNPLAADPATYHWFLGDGMVHGIALGGGRATSYRNRWMRTPSSSPLLGEPTPAGPPSVNATPLLANTSIVEHAGRLLALVETNLPTEFARDLTTIGTFDFAGALGSPMTAHPKLDPVTGEMWFIGNDLFGPPYLRLHVVDAAGVLQRTQDIEIPRPSMIHDFAITRSQVVIFDLPVVYDLGLLGGRPFPASWDPTAGARVGLLPRDGSTAPRWIEIDPCYVFHAANAYDDAAGRVIVDVCRYDRVFDQDLYGVADSTPTLERWTIDPTAGSVDRQEIDGRGHEFPRIDPRRLGSEHRYAYTTAFSSTDISSGVQLGGVYQHDLRTGRSATFDLGVGRSAGEPVFVPASADSGEDEGYVLAVVYDATRDGSDLIVVDATDVAAGPIATVTLPQRVPFGFHGIWSPTP
jgi:carotenoid cleavage dioxygenase-like enzyme